MAEVYLAEFEDTVVLHFGTDTTRINAYTLASTLAGIADAAKAANATLNPGYDIEVLVEGLGAGSFKARIRTIYHGAANLFSDATLRAIVIGVISNFIYQHTLAPNAEVAVHVNTTEVIIEQGETRIIVPRDVYEASQEVERSPKFRQGITQAIRALEEDGAVRTFGFSGHMEDSVPPVVIPRDRFAALPAFLGNADPATNRELLETTDLEILRAILERSTRRWEFVWNGMRISAPVSDQSFFDDFFAHRIMIAPGDALRVRLRIKQRRAPDIGVYINEEYEVVEVLQHIPKARQAALDVDSLRNSSNR